MTRVPLPNAAAPRITCAFTVPGEPVPCGRPRASVVKGHVHIRPDQKSAAYERAVGLVALTARPRVWRQDWAAYELRIRVYQSERRGDGDNFLKIVGDSGNGILWQDDRRIRRWSVDVIDELTRPRLEVLAVMVGELDAEADRKARARMLAARRFGRSRQPARQPAGEET